MTPADVAELLALAAAFDSRTVGRADVAAWHAALGDLPFDDTRDALVAWYREHRERVYPSDIRAGVKRTRRDRLERGDTEPPDADPNDVPAYLDALRSGRTRIADGTPRDVASVVAAIADRRSL